jgi:hypothetical protein
MFEKINLIENPKFSEIKEELAILLKKKMIDAGENKLEILSS